MAYGLKYQSTFDPVGPVSVDPVYTLQILEKDYGGSVTDVICSTVPILHKWFEDDPKAPIKGSSLSIAFVTPNDDITLESFFSVDDDQFQVQFFWFSQLMFIGFLVQDDCSEILVDYTHEINLSANDNLGLLKDVALDKAKVKYKFIDELNDSWATTAGHTLNLSAGAFSDEIQVGDQIRIHNIIFDVIYNVTDVSGNPDFIVAETVSTATHATTDSIDLYRPILFADKITLAAILDNCLAATGLEINTHFFCNFMEEAMDFTKSFIEQTLIDPQTFLKDGSSYNNYDDCYTILTKVLQRFNCTLFQAKGVWNIVHWDELRYMGYPIPGYSYDSDFNLLGAITLNEQSIIFGGFNKFQIGVGEDTVPETGLLHKIFRPFAFDKETFNFKPPARLLRNYDLQELGNLQGTSTTGSGITLQTTDEYDISWWVDDIFLASVSPPPPIHFIRIISDFLGNEIERYLVLGNSTTRLDSYKIEATKGDIFNLSLSERTASSVTNGVISVYFMLFNGTTQQYLTPTGWVVGQSPYENAVTGDTHEWNSFTTDAFKYPVPDDGILYIILFPEQDSFNVVISGETQIKDIRLDYNYFINQSTKIVGQTHKTEQVAVIKQNNDNEIFLDDSPRNSLAGTLFLPTALNVIQDRTLQWFLEDATHPHRLGYFTTFETEFWRRIVRSILEGTFYGLVSADTGGDHVSMLSVFTYTTTPSVNFIGGTMEIDYRNNNFKGTIWEICTNTEVDADLTSDYEFKYLYSTK